MNKVENEVDNSIDSFFVTAIAASIWLCFIFLAPKILTEIVYTFLAGGFVGMMLAKLYIRLRFGPRYRTRWMDEIFESYHKLTDEMQAHIDHQNAIIRNQAEMIARYESSILVEDEMPRQTLQ